PRKKVLIWAWILGGCAGLAFFGMVLFGLPLSDEPPGPPAIATQVQGVAPVPQPVPQAAARFWKSTLAWFPAEATLFGAVNLKAFGPVNLGDEWTQAAIRLALPAGAEQTLTPEHLGRVRIDGVSLAYYERPKPEDSRGIVQLEGLALDGR